MERGTPEGRPRPRADKAALTFQAAQLSAQAPRNKAVLAVKQAYYTACSRRKRTSRYFRPRWTQGRRR